MGRKTKEGEKQQLSRRSSFNIGYLTKEGVRNIRSNRLMSLASVAVLSSCLILIGCAIMLTANINAMLKNVEEQNVIMVYLEDNISEEQINSVGQAVRLLPDVKSADFIPKEESYKAQLKSMGDDAVLLEGLPDNPLPDAYKVTLSTLNNYSEVLELLGSTDNVLSVRGNSDIASQVRQLRTGASAVGSGMIIMLLCVSLFIIANTVRVTMYNRRLEISIMRAVGATKWFIRWPFIVEGVIIGIFSGIVSVFFVFCIYSFTMKTLSGIFTLFGNTAVLFSDYALPLLGAFILIGSCAGIFGSVFSMNRYLKEQEGSVVYDEDEI